VLHELMAIDRFLPFVKEYNKDGNVSLSKDAGGTKMEYVKQQKKPQQKTDIRPKRTGVSQQIKREYSEKQERLGMLAYIQENKVNLKTKQGGQSEHELAHIVQQKRGLIKPIAPVENVSVYDARDLDEMADNRTTISHLQQDCTERVIQRVPTPGEVAAARFLQLADWNLIQRNIQNPDVIRRELINVGIPQNIAQNIANNYLNDLPNFQLFAIMDYFKSLISEAYNTIQDGNGQSIRNNIGADYNPNQQTTPLLTNLTNILRNHYLPLIIQLADPNGPELIQHSNIPEDHPVYNMKEQIDEGMKRINRLLDPNLQQQLPRGANLPIVDIGDNIDFGGSTDSLHDINGRGVQDYGLFAGPSQVMHEQGHHIENYLGVNDFVNLHYYLYRYTNPNAPDRRSGWNQILGSERDTAIGGPGYNIHLPEMEFQNIISRNLPSGNDLIRYWLFNAGNAALYEIFSLFGAQERGQQFIDDFFLQESNSNSTSYATLYDPHTYETEFMSTTAELLSTVRGAQEVIDKDPTRVVLFIYLTNRPLYQIIDQDFQAQQPGQNLINLNTFMNII